MIADNYLVSETAQGAGYHEGTKQPERLTASMCRGAATTAQAAADAGTTMDRCGKDRQATAQAAPAAPCPTAGEDYQGPLLAAQQCQLQLQCLEQLHIAEQVAQEHEAQRLQDQSSLLPLWTFLFKSRLWRSRVQQLANELETRGMGLHTAIPALRSAFLSLAEEDAASVVGFESFGFSRTALSTLAQLRRPEQPRSPRLEERSHTVSTVQAERAKLRLLSTVATVASDPVKWAASGGACAKPQKATQPAPILLLSSTQIATNSVGTVLGKGGCNIKRLTTKLGPRAGVIYYEPATASFIMNRLRVAQRTAAVETEELHLAERARQLLKNLMMNFARTQANFALDRATRNAQAWKPRSQCHSETSLAALLDVKSHAATAFQRKKAWKERGARFHRPPFHTNHQQRWQLPKSRRLSSTDESMDPALHPGPGSHPYSSPLTPLPKQPQRGKKLKLSAREGKLLCREDFVVAPYQRRTH